jgi:hypothetical protein
MFVPHIDWEKTLALHSNEYQASITYMESVIRPWVVSLLGSSETWVPCELLLDINRGITMYKYRLNTFLEDIGEGQVKRITEEEMRALGHGDVRCSFITWFACFIHIIASSDDKLLEVSVENLQVGPHVGMVKDPEVEQRNAELDNVIAHTTHCALLEGDNKEQEMCSTQLRHTVSFQN